MQDGLLSGLRKLVEKTASEFEPGQLNIATAEAAVNEWATMERIACAAKLRAAVRVEELGLDAEATVGNASGVRPHEARRQARLHKKLKNKKKTAEAFNKGELSPTEAGAIGDAVDAVPEAEESLLELAASGASTTDLLDECERIRREALAADGSLAARQRQARCLRTWTDSMGMTCLSGRLEPLVGAKLIAELDRRSDQLFRAQVRAKAGVDSHEQRRADALAQILDACGAERGGKRRGPRTVIQLHVTKEAAKRGFTEPGEKCQTADGTPIPMSAVDEAFLDPDTTVQEVTFDAVDVRSISSHKRYIPARLRDAFAARGVCCAVPGCGRTKGLQKDHHEDFSHGGPTALLNLGWLCHYHHSLKTRKLYRLWRDERGDVHWEPTARSGAPPDARGA